MATAAAISSQRVTPPHKITELHKVLYEDYIQISNYICLLLVSTLSPIVQLVKYQTFGLGKWGSTPGRDGILIST
jgi:hypothetical protein